MVHVRETPSDLAGFWILAISDLTMFLGTEEQ